MKVLTKLSKKSLRVFALLVACVSLGGAQTRPSTPAPGSPERKAILDALRLPVEKKLKRKVVFKVDVLKSFDGWAFLRGTPQQPGGKPMNYNGTPYQQLITEGAFDDGISALLKLKGKTWTVVTYNIGATDVVWADWSEKHKAPPELFN